MGTNIRGQTGPFVRKWELLTENHARTSWPRGTIYMVGLHLVEVPGIGADRRLPDWSCLRMRITPY